MQQRARIGRGGGAAAARRRIGFDDPAAGRTARQAPVKVLVDMTATERGSSDFIIGSVL